MIFTETGEEEYKMPKAEEDIQKDKEKFHGRRSIVGIVRMRNLKNVPMLSMNCRSILPRPPF